MAPAMAYSFVSTKSWDLTNFVVHQGHGVKGLAERSLKTLPKQYIQPLKERLDTKKVVLEESIPVIDMLRWEDDPTVAESICDAAEKWGFFQIINHGVDIQVLENAKAATNSFFGMPAADKLKYSKENSPTNNVRFGTSFIPQAEASLEWKDFLSLFYVSEDEAASYWPPACKNETIEFMNESNFLCWVQAIECAIN